MRYLAALLLVAACAAPTAPLDSGCRVYGERRVSMPRPLVNNAEGRWIATLDAAMTDACR